MIRDILYDESCLQQGWLQSIDWSPSLHPHIVICGATGSGKTYFAKLLLGKIAVHEPDALITVCDYKSDTDFEFLEGCERYYRFMECSSGLQLFYDRLQARQRGTDKSRNLLILFFDEFASFINSLEKKEAEEQKKKISYLLMLGRSFHIHMIVSLQRADANYFQSARDNFSLCIGMGVLSDESKSMLFRDFKSEMKPDRKQGTGYMTNGTVLQAIQVPSISNLTKLHQAIRQSVSR